MDDQTTTRPGDCTARSATGNANESTSWCEHDGGRIIPAAVLPLLKCPRTTPTLGLLALLPQAQPRRIVLLQVIYKLWRW